LKRIVLLLAVTAILVLALSVPAFAQGKLQGKPQGKFEQGLDKARSICSASGLNDNADDEQGADLGQVQSYGDYVKDDYAEPSDELGRATPGIACNGHLSPYTPPAP
jgi:hypothetical protein